MIKIIMFYKILCFLFGRIAAHSHLSFRGYTSGEWGEIVERELYNILCVWVYGECLKPYWCATTHHLKSEKPTQFTSAWGWMLMCVDLCLCLNGWCICGGWKSKSVSTLYLPTYTTLNSHVTLPLCLTFTMPKYRSWYLTENVKRFVNC